MLEVREIDTYYDDFKVLKNVSLNVKKGEFVVLIGPNGHGKSTLLKTVCGLVNPSSGEILFNGEDILKLPIKNIVKMGLVYIPEDRRLFANMTVLENLKMGAYNINARSKEAENLEYVFRLFPNLASFKKRPASTLSGGEARMLAVGRGIMSSSKFLAIDEPSLGLAPKLRNQVFEKIKEINKSGITILMVEQNISESIDFADRVYVLEDGEIIYQGGKEEALKETIIKEAMLGI
jgi:branched-chain amino acid transport system ATP-binding protein